MKNPLVIKKPCSGFTFIEILVAVIFLMSALVYLFSLISSSNRATVDSYQETIAYELANETIEWVAGMGFRSLLTALKYSPNQLASIGVGGYQHVENFQLDDGSQTHYPEDYKLFERCVELIPSKPEDIAKDKLVLVRVSVRLKHGIFRKSVIVLERLVGED